MKSLTVCFAFRRVRCTAEGLAPSSLDTFFARLFVIYVIILVIVHFDFKLIAIPRHKFEWSSASARSVVWSSWVWWGT